MKTQLARLARSLCLAFALGAGGVATAASGDAAEGSLPAQELTPRTLYHFLLAEIAGARGQIGLSAQLDLDLGVGNCDALGARAVTIDDRHELLAVLDRPFVGLREDHEAFDEDLRDAPGVTEAVDRSLIAALFELVLQNLELRHDPPAITPPPEEESYETRGQREERDEPDQPRLHLRRAAR